MGTEQSTQVPAHVKVLESHNLWNKVVPIDQRDLPKEWKQEGHAFVYFVDQTVAGRPDIIRKVIHAAGSQFFYVEDHQDYSVKFLSVKDSKVRSLLVCLLISELFAHLFCRDFCPI